MPTDQNVMLQRQLQAINAAIAAGVTSVSYDGKSSQFRSLSEMRSVRDELMRQLGLNVKSRRTLAGFNAGFR